MTKSELIENLSTKHPTLSAKEVEGIVKDILQKKVIVLKFVVWVASLYTIVNHELAVILKPVIL